MNRFDTILVAAGALALLAAPALAAKAKLDAPAPDFNVVTLTKDKIDLASLHGQVVVINRWATWCGPCCDEFVMFDGYAALRAKYGLTIVAIETGGAGASGPMRDLAKAVHFPVVL